MLRHEFQPGRLTAGLFLTVAGIAFLGDAGGAWEIPWFVIIPIVTGGLCLAAVTGMVGSSIRRGRAARKEVRDASGGGTTAS
ncbi:hypothetical protein NGF19_11915 [Streptomyces sp. RY43-2]|uniref:Integral membrane protein n=1 Tax=Streptomyces macrolidinus TaxID=2952607 RepID=A0ABT0ZD35_9ACTN|nr:hypothetical protein [Streptomyces macrolidinus]MCN9241487.1 hypothetical protein [Streptomyces macrolidinus]